MIVSRAGRKSPRFINQSYSMAYPANFPQGSSVLSSTRILHSQRSISFFCASQSGRGIQFHCDVFFFLRFSSRFICGRGVASVVVVVLSFLQPAKKRIQIETIYIAIYWKKNYWNRTSIRDFSRHGQQRQQRRLRPQSDPKLTARRARC